MAPCIGRDAQVSDRLGIGLLGEFSLRFFSDEEGSQLILDDFEDETEVLPNQGFLASKNSDRTAPSSFSKPQ